MFVLRFVSFFLTSLHGFLMRGCGWGIGMGIEDLRAGGLVGRDIFVFVFVFVFVCVLGQIHR